MCFFGIEAWLNALRLMRARFSERHPSSEPIRVTKPMLDKCLKAITRGFCWG